MKPNRQSIRLKGYDYSAEGAYFITIVCKDRLSWFGEITDGEMQLSEAGEIVEEEWLRGAELRSQIMLDAFVVMPNHFHGIVIIGEPLIPLAGRGVPRHAQLNESESSTTGLPRHSGLPRGSGLPRHAPTMGSKPNTLGTIIRMFKQACTKRIRQTISADFAWQRNYHEHIIRNQKELHKIQDYIQNNPNLWEKDMFHS
jgi:REP element-mobilizing transposase RayT